MIAIAKAMGCHFTLQDKPVSYEEVFALTGFLPGILRRADQLCSFCLGYGLGLTFERAENSKLGVVAHFDSVTPNSLRLLCVTDVLYDLMHHSALPETIPLDDLVSD